VVPPMKAEGCLNLYLTAALAASLRMNLEGVIDARAVQVHI
jgi:hypothetical protein